MGWLFGGAPANEIPVSLTRHGRGVDDRPWTEIHGYRPLSLRDMIMTEALPGRTLAVTHIFSRDGHRSP